MHDMTPSVSEWVLIILTCIVIFGLGNVGLLGRGLARLHRLLRPLPPSTKPSDGNEHERDHNSD